MEITFILYRMTSDRALIEYGESKGRDANDAIDRYVEAWDNPPGFAPSLKPYKRTFIASATPIYQYGKV